MRHLLHLTTLAGLLAACSTDSGGADSGPDAAPGVTDGGVTQAGADASQPALFDGSRSAGSLSPGSLPAISIGGVRDIWLFEHEGGALVVASAVGGTTIRAIDADLDVRWERGIADGRTRHAVVGPGGEVHVAVEVDFLDTGSGTIECDRCGVLLALSSDGEPQWLQVLPLWKTAMLAPIEDGGVVLSTTTKQLEVLTGFSADGSKTWTLIEDREGPLSRIAGSGGEVFYTARGYQLQQRAASDGAILWEVPWEPDGLVSMQGGGVAIHKAGRNPRLGRGDVEAFDPEGNPLWTTKLPKNAAWLASARDGGVLLASRAPGAYPVYSDFHFRGAIGRIDAAGTPRWQWPGTLMDGAFEPQPGGFCEAMVAQGPGDSLFVLAEWCAGSAALLDGIDTHNVGAWLLAHVTKAERDNATAGCGNGWIDVGEECDGQDIPFTSCASEFASGVWTGASACTDCMKDTSSCVNTCGNGEIDDREDCDGDEFAPGIPVSCAEGGPPPCMDCQVDLGGCKEPSLCGNGQLDDGEDCDEDEFRWNPCNEYFLGKATGPSVCRSDCRGDVSVCDVCTCTDCEVPDLCKM